MTMLKEVPLVEALRRTSDPDDYRQWLEADRRWNELSDRRTDEARTLYDFAWKLGQALKGDFVEMLTAGDLAATGFRLPIDPGSRRVEISADLWEILEIDFRQSEAQARGIQLIKIEVLKPAYNITRALRFSPMHLGPVPDKGFRAEDLPPAIQPPFVHNDDFSIVALGSNEFKFGAAAANVLRLLHSNSDVVGGWMHGKKLMSDARAEGTKIGDLFKRHTNPSWKLLIESDERGHYRLKAK